MSSSSKRPSKYPPSAPPSGWPEPHRSIRPSQPRNRAILAGVCATLLGAMIVSAIIRSCAGEAEPEDHSSLRVVPGTSSTKSTPKASDGV
jgi:hypothetical protein